MEAGQQEQIQGQQPQAEEQVNLETKLVEARVKLQMAEEAHAQQLRHREELARQQIALADATTAAKIARESARP